MGNLKSKQVAPILDSFGDSGGDTKTDGVFALPITPIPGHNFTGRWVGAGFFKLNLHWDQRFVTATLAQRRNQDPTG